MDSNKTIYQNKYSILSWGSKIGCTKHLSRMIDQRIDAFYRHRAF